MSWIDVKEAVRTAVATALQLTDATGADGTTLVPLVTWENQRSAHRFSSGVLVDLRLGNVQGHGRDETRYELVTGATPALTDYIPTYGGYRTFSVWVRVYSDNQEGTDAVAVLGGRLRTRLRRPEARAILAADEVAIVTIGNTFDTDYRDQNGRMMSASLTELRLATVEQDTDAADEATGWVAIMEDGEGTFDGGAFPIEEGVTVVTNTDNEVIV